MKYNIFFNIFDMFGENGWVATVADNALVWR